MRLSRRAALLGLTSAFSLGRTSLALANAATERRFVVVILRGALDGMAAIQPYGDPSLGTLRGALLLPEPGRDGGVLDMGGFFGLHPAMPAMHGMYAQGEMLPVHAVAGPYRVRSHFEAQDYMEYGSDHTLSSGWLNRVAGLLPAVRGGTETALSVGTAIPLLLRGQAPVGSWLPKSFSRPDADLYSRMLALHQPDPVTGPAVVNGLKERGFTEATLTALEPGNRFAFPALCAAAGKLLAAADGPRLAALEIGGWDTHANQKGRVGGTLKQLDDGMASLKSGLGDSWRKTVVLVMTEFGRTVRVNGTGGTDHGTGAAAFVLGGHIAGGKVMANWPGLSSANLLENRDLQPTIDLRSLAKGLLASQFHLDPKAQSTVFPDSLHAPAATGLLRT
jgi:uncharacterized protein (DUF1501 family)